jgi:endonuclease YncB( thermonuclease family)
MTINKIEIYIFLILLYKLNMLQSFLCCLRRKNINNAASLTVKNINDDVCVSITEDIVFKKSITLSDINTIYDSTEWLNKLDKNIDWKDTIQFIPPVEKGIVIKVYDGDTITIASKLPYPSSPLYRFSVRLNGIDCPEIKGKDENEKQCAQIAKQEMSDLVLNKIVTLKNVNTEKYGRILADVYRDNLHVNKYMIEKRLAVVYDGGTKISPKNWMNYYYKGEL